MKVYKNISELVGGTPMVELRGYAEAHKLNARIFAKLEKNNPSGSIKDRAAAAMLEDAEARGLLTKNTLVIEPTSGNTGIGLAALCAAKGYKLTIIMPDTMTVERRMLIAAYGATLVLTPGAQGMKGAVAKAEELHAEHPDSIIAGQFVNPANPLAHMRTTGPEIWADTDGEVAAFVAGVGTGGTVTGVGRYLKSKNEAVKVFAAEPAESAVISGEKAGPHGIQGIGAGFIPQTFDGSVTDGTIKVGTAEAKNAARELARTDGLLVGVSGGCNLFAAAELSKREEFRGKIIVTVFPDSGDKYLSTDLYAPKAE